MLELRCEWLDVWPGEKRHGYDLGHMAFVGDKGICTSRGRNPDQAMMLTLSAGELLYGLENFVGKKQLEYRFIGVDSSFSVYFDRIKGGRVGVWCGGGGSVAEIGVDELLSSVLMGVEAFAAQVMDELSEDEPGCEDLIHHLRRFKRFLLSR
jgi:hypothetical protein